MGDIYVAARRLKVGDEFREPGQPVPEAASWTTLRELLEGGYISIVSNEGGTFHPLHHGWSVDPSSVTIDKQQYLDLCEKAGVDPDIGNIGVTGARHQLASLKEFGNNEAQAHSTEPNGSEGLGGVSIGTTTFNPKTASIEEVMNHAESHPEEISALVQREIDGKNRKSLIAGLNTLRR